MTRIHIVHCVSHNERHHAVVATFTDQQAAEAFFDANECAAADAGYTLYLDDYPINATAPSAPFSTTTPE